MKAEFEACERGILVRRQLRTPKVHRCSTPVPPGFEHESEAKVRVRRPSKPRGHVQSHLQRLRRPIVENHHRPKSTFDTVTRIFSKHRQYRVQKYYIYNLVEGNVN